MEFSGKPPLPKKGKGGEFFQFKKKKGTLASSRQNIGEKLGGGQARSRTIAIRGLTIRKKLSSLFVHSVNKDTLGIAWFLLTDAIHAEEKIIGREPSSTWEEDVIIMVRRVTLKENAPG